MTKAPWPGEGRVEHDRPVLLVTKKSFYEVYGLDRKDSGFLAQLDKDRELSDWLMADYEENREVIAAVESFLALREIPFVRSTGRRPGDDSQYRLILAVGGDGTLLAASHEAVTTPVVGINSRPGRSIGYFCAGDRTDFPVVLSAILEGRMFPATLSRMDIYVNGERKSPPVLNDVLYCAASPAATSVYRLRLGEIEEIQRSSGVWIATPAGSTAGIGAAGGRKMNLSGSSMQFLVREPYMGVANRYRLDRGMFCEGLCLTSLTPHASIHVDGSRIAFELNYGDRVEPRVSAAPLRIFVQG